ncbi:MAG: hypothetical protein AAFY41_14440 [Bacteroidota bacterium]
MKVFATAFVLFAAHTFCLNVHAQSTDFVGSWKIDFDKTVQLLSTDSRVDYDSMDVSVKNQMKAQLINQRFNFNADGTFSAGVQGGTFHNGNWQTNNSSLILKYDQGYELTQEYQQPNSRTIILRVAPASSPALIKKIHLIRN